MRYLASVVPWPYPENGALTYYREHALPAKSKPESKPDTKPESKPESKPDTAQVKKQ